MTKTERIKATKLLEDNNAELKEVNKTLEKCLKSESGKVIRLEKQVKDFKESNSAKSSKEAKELIEELSKKLNFSLQVIGRQQVELEVFRSKTV